MWTFEHSQTTRAAVAEVFALLSDVGGWPDWNAGVESVTLDGPFVAGTRGTMAMPGQEPLSVRLIWGRSSRRIRGRDRPTGGGRGRPGPPHHQRIARRRRAYHLSRDDRW